MMCGMPWSLRNLGSATDVSSKMPLRNFQKVRRFIIGDDAIDRRVADPRRGAEK